MIERLQRFFASWRFPAIVLSVLVTFKILLVTALLVPPPPGLESFAEDFKTWCFGYDPATGKMQTAYVLVTLAEPLVLGSIIAAIWWKPLRTVVRESPWALLPYLGTAAVIVAGALLGLVGMRGEARAAELPFPAAAIRTSLESPRMTLTDQEGESVSIESERGRVVVVTGVYASCGYTCPMILGQAKRAISALSEPERRDVLVAAITLDPEHDGKAQLFAMAKAQQVGAPTFHLLWGEPQTVNAALDDLSISRKRDPDTGVIDHANLFVLIDRHGKIAYRLSLGAQQEAWLVAALHVLVAERS